MQTLFQTILQVLKNAAELSHISPLQLVPVPSGIRGSLEAPLLVAVTHQTLWRQNLPVTLADVRRVL